MNDEPNEVVRSSRQVIEHKLLEALDDPACVAILASKDDLDLLIYCLSKVAEGKYVAEDGIGLMRSPGGVVRELRAREFGAGLEQLREEAFGVVECPGCDVEIIPENAGGYRTFCGRCVSVFPPFPNDGKGHLIAEGCRYPNFRWE